MRIPYESNMVKCPRQKDARVNVNEFCSNCYWCSCIDCTESKVLCRWTKEKEQIRNGERIC